MAIHDDFLDLLKYVPIEILSVQASQDYIDRIQDCRFKNDTVHDIIDYERLMYIKFLLPEDEHIQRVIHEIEDGVAMAYIKKQKIMNKFYLERHDCWDEDKKNLKAYPSNNEISNEVYLKGKKDQI